MKRSWLGRRVSVRRAREVGADGRPRLGDVVGELVELDEHRAVIVGRRGRTEVDVASITAARLVEASVGEELALQAVAARALRPAHSQRLDGWLLRAEGGRPRRANSILTTAPLNRPLASALDAARKWYQAHGLPVLVQVPVRARQLLDAELESRGWAVEAPARVLTASLDRLARGNDDSPVRLSSVRLDGSPDESWLAMHGGHRDLLTRHGDVVFASVRDADRVVALGRGTVDDGWLGVTGLVVDSAQRRRGAARAIMTALGDWGRARGAARAYVQVETDNMPALNLYERLGFWAHHDYHYRCAPQVNS